MKDEQAIAALTMHIISDAEIKLTKIWNRPIQLSMGLFKKEMTYQEYLMYQLQKCICDSFGITWGDMVKKNRSDYNRIPRQVFCYLAYDRTILALSLKEIARIVNYHDHTSVLNAIKRIQGFIDVGEEIGIKVQIIKNRFNEDIYKA